VTSASSDINFNISPNRKYNLISSVNSIINSGIIRSVGGNRLLFHDKLSIFFLEDIHQISQKPIQVPLEYLVVGENSIRNLKAITELLDYKCLILDATIGEWHEKTIVKQMKSVVTIHSIRKDGALIISI
jgi:hypothetical protein